MSAPRRSKSPSRPRTDGARTNGKTRTGIAGLDEALRGGLPNRKTTLVFGGPGTGKTVLALQALVNGASELGEPGIFVAFEERSSAIIANATSFGWNLPRLQKKKLFFLDAQLRPDVVRAGSFDLSGVLASLSIKAKEYRAKRLVFDGLDVLLGLLDDPAAERAELCRIHEWLLNHELTGIITAKADVAEPFSQARYGFTAYMADCALLLSRRYENAVSERALTILKCRGSGFSENSAPFVIGPTGIEVAEQNSAVEITHASTERLTTGIARFDKMLNGGYLRAASVLITGLPGTAKSTLCGSFVQGVCRNRERALYVSFDEQSEETLRNLASVNIRLRRFVERGELRMLSALSLKDSAEVQLMRIRAAIRDHRASCVVIDPISALAKSSDPSTAHAVLARFIHWTKINGITTVATSLLSAPDPIAEATALGVSTLCDTWIHLAYAQRAGERNRALTVIKSRGTAHSNQVRELVLSSNGVTLADVYAAGGEVFMGTLRWEEENRQRDEEHRLASEAKVRRLELEAAHAEMKARLDVLHREVSASFARLAAAKKEEADRVARNKTLHRERLHQRGADDSGRHKPRGDTGKTARRQDAAEVS